MYYLENEHSGLRSKEPFNCSGDQQFFRPSEGSGERCSLPPVIEGQEAVFYSRSTASHFLSVSGAKGLQWVLLSHVELDPIVG